MMSERLAENPLRDVKVIFVLGGPGAGKGTQCSKLMSSYQLHHFSMGDVLRAEMNKSESKYASIIRQNMSEGRVGPPEITLALLKAAMSEKVIGEGTQVFLIDGFPRKMDQAELFESMICAPTATLYLECPESIQQERLLRRAITAGRFDDNIEVIQKRFKTFSETSMPVIEHYEKQGKLFTIDASIEATEVYKSIEIALGHLIDPLS